MTIQVPLGYGLVALLVSEESDRPVYVPPPIARADHHDRCGCQACVASRSVKGACQ